MVSNDNIRAELYLLTKRKVMWMSGPRSV